MGWSLLEAMACGCCIVGSKDMPVAEVIDDNVQGNLISIDNHQELSGQIISLLNNSSERNRLSLNAREKSLAWDQNMTLKKLLDFLLGFK